MILRAIDRDSMFAFVCCLFAREGEREIDREREREAPIYIYIHVCVCMYIHTYIQ